MDDSAKPMAGPGHARHKPYPAQPMAGPALGRRRLWAADTMNDPALGCPRPWPPQPLASRAQTIESATKPMASQTRHRPSIGSAETVINPSHAQQIACPAPWPAKHIGSPDHDGPSPANVPPSKAHGQHNPAHGQPSIRPAQTCPSTVQRRSWASQLMAGSDHVRLIA
jgi:hypothetical protein